MTDSTLLTIAKSRAAANRAAKALTQAQLDKAIANLNAAAKSLKSREQAREARKRAADLKKLTAMMKKLGVTTEEVAAAAGKPGRGGAKGKAKSVARAKRSTRKVAPKYELMINGDKHQWTGRGRMPVVFREFIANGGSLDDCLIK